MQEERSLPIPQDSLRPKNLTVQHMTLIQEQRGFLRRSRDTISSVQGILCSQTTKTFNIHSTKESYHPEMSNDRSKVVSR